MPPATIAVLAFGSTGDVLPYVALALGLQAHGYRVRFVTHARFAAIVEAWGLQAVAVEDDPHAALKTEAGRAWLDSGADPLEYGRQLRRLLDPLLHGFALRTLSECQDAAAMIASGLAVFVATHVAEKTGIPCFPAYLQPVTATTEFRNPFVPNLVRDGALWNWLTHLVYRHGAGRLFRRSINRMRRESLGLAPLRWNEPSPEMRHGAPILYGYSPSVLPKPRDWPAWAHVTGYWFLPAQDWQPPPEIVDFLESGEPPVCIGFGSMTDRDPERMTGIAVEALARAGRRGILLTGWGALSNASLPDSVRKIEAAPHEWLFPKACAVVHHGGAGTTAAGLRAGVPIITVPFFGDQFFWGGVVHAIGAGPQPIPRKRLSVKALAAAIREATADSTMTERARAMAARIRTEDGVRNAVLALRSHQGNPGSRMENVVA